MRDAPYESGDYVVLVTDEQERWVVMATRDPDCYQQAVNLAEGYLEHMEQGQVAVAQIVSYDTKYPYTGNEL